MAQGNVATPFLDLRSFVREESETPAPAAQAPALGSPFVSVYELEGGPGFVDPQQEARATLAQELYDQEFEEALFDLTAEARALHEERLAAGGPSVEGERLLGQHFQRLTREAEAVVDALGRAYGSRAVGALSEAELDAFAQGYAPAADASPELEAFLGGFAKKLVKGVKGLAKKAGSLAASVTLGPILEKVKAIVKPMMQRVLQAALDKLPESVRPAARQLAERIAGRRPDGTGGAGTPADAAVTAPGDASAVAQPPAGDGVTEIQEELDRQLASLFTAADEVELELEVAHARGEARQPAPPVYAELDRARERFIDGLSALKDGEDPGPYVQDFVPAVLPALRLGVKLIGRGRVVSFLSGFLAKIIGKLVGPATAPALSRAIVDAGLKLLSLEVSPQDESRAAASAVAATVEETVRRVSALPEYVLDDQELLEGFALAAFEQAAAANLPPVLSEAAYRERPDLLESQGAPTCWVMLPLRRRKRYKKCARVFQVRIGPSMADEIETFEGPLADHLQDQLGVEEGAAVEAEVHLYETLPGTMLPDIARGESEAPGGGTAAPTNVAQLHPLTPKAAGLLLGEPRMGRVVPAGTHRLRVGVGQRFYRLSIPGRRLLTAAGRHGRPQPRRLGGLRVALDVAKGEIRLQLYLSEVKAQGLAVSLRRQAHPGALAARLLTYVGRRLAPILRGDRPARIRVVHAGLPPGEAPGAALKRLPADATAALAAKIQEHAALAFGELVKAQSQRIVAAAEDAADGITLRVTIAQPAGLDLLGKALLPGGQAAGLADAIRGGAKPDVRVDVAPGDARD